MRGEEKKHTGQKDAVGKAPDAKEKKKKKKSEKREDDMSQKKKEEQPLNRHGIPSNQNKIMKSRTPEEY